jgi:hypothetical protein
MIFRDQYIFFKHEECKPSFSVLRKCRNAYRILVGKPEGKRPLGRPRRRWADNIKMDLREIGWDGMDWIELAQDRDQGSCEHGNEPQGFRKMLGSS